MKKDQNARAAQIKSLQDQLYEIAFYWGGAFDPDKLAEYNRLIAELLQIPEWDGYIGRKGILPDNHILPELWERFDYWHCFATKAPKNRQENPVVNQLLEQIYAVKSDIRGKAGDALVEKYHQVVHELLKFEEWEGHIEFEAWLPNELMPQEWKERYDYEKALKAFEEGFELYRNT